MYFVFVNYISRHVDSYQIQNCRNRSNYMILVMLSSLFIYRCSILEAVAASRFLLFVFSLYLPPHDLFPSYKSFTFARISLLAGIASLLKRLVTGNIESHIVLSSINRAIAMNNIYNKIYFSTKIHFYNYT